HESNRFRRFHAGGALDSRVEWNLSAGAAGELRFHRRREKKIDELLRLVRVWAALNEGERVGDEEGAELAGVAIGIDDENVGSALDFDNGVVRVGQADGDLAAGG